MKKILSVLFLVLSLGKVYSQSCCSGSFYDIAVVPPDSRGLVNAGLTYDDYRGVWDQFGTWNKNTFTSWQIKPVIAAAYRFNKHIQAGVSFPYVFNRNELPGLVPQGSGLGDITLNGRYEFTHEFLRKSRKGRDQIDEKTPYTALTFGIVLPTGTSEETAKTDAEITGKGFYSVSLGLSAMKSVVKNKLQIAGDLSWQHGFEKSYDKYYNQQLMTPYTKKPGERINYGISVNYLINNSNSASFSAGGFTQGLYAVNGTEGINSNERALNFTVSYSYYPKTFTRITPSVKYFIPSDDFGKNAPGSLTFVLNLVYYIENLDSE